jgi:hypothetical protein
MTRSLPPSRGASRSSRCSCCSTSLRRAAVASHVLFAAAGAHALAYGFFSSASLALPLHVARVQSALAANGAALLLAAAAAAFALPRIAPRVARAVDAALPCSARARRRGGAAARKRGAARGGDGAARSGNVVARGGSGAELRRRLGGTAAAAADADTDADADADAADANAATAADASDDSNDSNCGGGARSAAAAAAASPLTCCGWLARPLRRALAGIQEDAGAADSVFVGFITLLWSFATAAPVCTLVFEKRWHSRGQLVAYAGVSVACAAGLAAVAVASCARSGILAHRARERLSTLRLVAWPLLAHGAACALFLAMHLDRLGLEVGFGAPSNAGATSGRRGKGGEAEDRYSLWSPFF